MLLRGSLLLLCWVGRPLLLSRLLQPTQPCLLSRCCSSSFQPSAHSPTSPWRSSAPGRAGHTAVPGLPRCLTAPAPRASTQPRGRGAAGLAAGQGCREEVPARGGGWGGSPGLRAPGAGGCRAPGRRLPAMPEDTGRLGAARSPGRTGSEVSGAAGAPGEGAGGMHFALGHPRPLPPALWGHWDGPSLQQPISGRPRA